MKKFRSISIVLALLLAFSAVPAAFAADPCETHSFGDWVITVEPGCTTDGVKTRTCSVCGATEDAVAPAKGHNTVTETVHPTCTESGFTKIYCPTCGYQYSNTVIPSAGHTPGNRKVTATATAQSAGQTVSYCTVCGELVASGTYTLDDPAVGFTVSEPEEYGNGMNAVTVTVELKNNPGLWGVSFYLHFDPAFTFVCAENGNVFDSDSVLFGNGAIKVSDNSWASAIFERDGTEIGNKNAICFFADSADFTDNTENGILFKVKLAYDSALEGTYGLGFAYDPGSVINSDGEDVDILFVGDSFTIEKEQAPVLLGDVNGDGKINSRDLAQLKKYLAGTLLENDIVMKNADINEDTRVNSRDVSALKKLFVQ